MTMMSEEQGARDPRFGVAVEEGDASGAAPLFDGNHTNDTETWLVANDTLGTGGWDDETFRDRTLPQLMYFTAMGHLSWVVFPPQGYRL